MDFKKIELNEFTDLDEIIYDIIKYLAFSQGNEDIFKLLKYNEVDALDKSITKPQIIGLLPSDDFPNGYKDDTRIFLNEPTRIFDDTDTFLSIGMLHTSPANNHLSRVFIEFKVMYHKDLTMIKGYRNRGLTLAQLIISKLNGLQLENSLGELKFSKECSFDKMSRINDKYDGFRFTMCRYVA